MKLLCRLIFILLLLISFSSSVSAAWSKVIDLHLNNSEPIPSSMFLSIGAASTTLNNVTLTPQTTGANWNITSPFVGMLYIGQIYPSEHSKFRLNFSMDKDGGFPTVDIRFGDLIDVASFKGSGAYQNTLRYYAANGSLQGIAFTTSGQYTDLQIEYYSNGTAILTNLLNTSQNATTKFHLDRTYVYPYLTPTLIQFSMGLGGATKMNLTIADFEQSIDTSPTTPTNKAMAFGFDGPRPNWTYGKDWLVSHGMNGTIWIDDDIYWGSTGMNDTGRADILDAINNHSFEVGIHFTQRLTDLSLTAAYALIDTEIANVTSYIGQAPKSWSSLQNADNSTHANYIYNKYKMLWRNAPDSVQSFTSLGQISDTNNITYFWNNASRSASYMPAFTHSVTASAESDSMTINSFDNIFGNITNNSIAVMGFKYWYSLNNYITNVSNLQNTTTATSINWTWTDPTDADFNHTMVYLNGTFITNVSAGTQYYLNSSLASSTQYTISLQTVDYVGNINTTWINQTTTTLAAPATARQDYVASACVDTLNWGVVGSALLVVLVLVIAGVLAIGFMTGAINFNTFPIMEFLYVLIAVVCIGSIGVGIISPIINLSCP